MIAKVTLTKGPLSYTANGRTFKRGQTQILTKEREINYYKSEYGFSVVYQAGAGNGKKEEYRAEDDSKPDEDVRSYTKETLESMPKIKVIEIVENLSIPMIGNEKKKEMIEAILMAQEMQTTQE